MRHFPLLLLPLLLILSCKRNGTGGDATVTLITKHHTTIIPGTTVFIKYGEGEFPGPSPSDYDDSKVADANGKVEFPGLLNGKYYFYGTGYDSSISSPVDGGMSVRVKFGNSEEVVLQVTED